jgi:diaminohydroxyphosphoribosylaminopyrimidine deaminase/5-amino-6-(5-phosphoribosylamino)uracil reductase
VVVAVEDPHGHVRGKGLKMLHEAGIETEVGICRDEARELNAAYFSHVERGRPLVTAKWAMTLDGKIATRTGDARWISSEQSRQEAHYDRGCTGAVIVGIGTVLVDDPELTARGEVGRQPVRVVVDTDLKLPLESQLVQTADLGPVFVYAADDSSEERQHQLEDAGVYIILLPRQGKSHLRWMEICTDLGERGVNSAMIEGGGSLIASAFQERAVDRVKIFVAPKVFGGENAKSPVEGPGVPDVSRAVTFARLSSRALGPDIVIEGNVVYPTEDGPSPSGYWAGYGDGAH